MDVHNLRRVWLGTTLTVVGATTLLALLLRPDTGGVGSAFARFAPPALAGVTLLWGLSQVLGLFERQANRIERQKREIATLHAMDVTILGELDEPTVLEKAILHTLEALDAEAAGIVLLDPETQTPRAESFQALDRADEERARFQACVRSGGRPHPDWAIAIVPIGETGGAVGYMGAGRFRPCRPFSPGEFGLLAALSDTVSVALANVAALQATRDAERVKADLERERRVARALTEGLLPFIPPRVGHWAFSRRYEAQSPEAPVGGDIYDLFPLGEGRWAVLIADVSGKGLSAAKKTAMVKYALRSLAREHQSPAKVVTRLNEVLSDDPDITEFVTLVYGVLDETDNRFIYASAGHEPPVIRRADGTFEMLPSTGVVLGLSHDSEYDEGCAILNPGDGLLLSTDGLAEARTVSDRTFLDTKGVQQLLTNLCDVPASDVADCLLNAVREFTGGPLTDDVAILWVERIRVSDAPPPAR